MNTSRPRVNILLLVELLSNIVSQCTVDSLCSLALVCRGLNELTTPMIWYRLVGLENLLGVLDDSLSAASGPGAARETQIPALHSLDPSRIDRFLHRASCVWVLHLSLKAAGTMPWSGLERLRGLFDRDNRRTLLPHVREVYLSCGAMPTAPLKFDRLCLDSLCIGPSLRRLHMEPMSSYMCPTVHAGDAVNVLNALRESQTPLESLELFPAGAVVDVALRRQVLQALLPVAHALTTLAISEWCLSLEAVTELASLNLTSLDIRGSKHHRPAALRWLSTLPLQNTSFPNLERLSLNGTRLQETVWILSTPHILARVSSLRVSILDDVFEIDVEDEDMSEHGYTAHLFQRISAGGSDTLRHLSMVFKRDPSARPLQLEPEWIALLGQLSLHSLRLYSARIAPAAGFEVFYNPASPSWRSLRHLSMIDQPLRSQDLVALAEFPDLRRIGARVTQSLGEEVDIHVRECVPFTRPLELNSQFYLRRSVDSRRTASIIKLFKTLCPRGVRFGMVDRTLRWSNSDDVRDGAWVSQLKLELAEGTGRPASPLVWQ